MLMKNKNNENSMDRAERERRAQRLGQQLRSLYTSVTEEDVPDDLLRLLDEADQKRKSHSSGDGADGSGQ